MNGAADARVFNRWSREVWPVRPAPQEHEDN